jgi:hypothetical protein
MTQRLKCLIDMRSHALPHKYAQSSEQHHGMPDILMRLMLDIRECLAGPYDLEEVSVATSVKPYVSDSTPIVLVRATNVPIDRELKPLVFAYTVRVAHGRYALMIRRGLDMRSDFVKFLFCEPNTPSNWNFIPAALTTCDMHVSKRSLRHHPATERISLICQKRLLESRVSTSVKQQFLKAQAEVTKACRKGILVVV